LTVLVDASVALKWVIQETGSDLAEEVARSDRLIAPDFLLLECANVLTQKARRGHLHPDDAVDRLRFIERSVARFIPLAPHVREAQRLSLALGHSAYDCLYLAAALAEEVVLVTADDAFAALAERAFPRSLRRLSATAPPD
jgi:predicted nucleic acid-binding protein